MTSQSQYEERELTCINCKKKVKRILLKTKKTKTYLCQNCGGKQFE